MPPGGGRPRAAVPLAIAALTTVVGAALGTTPAAAAADPEPDRLAPRRSTQEAPVELPGAVARFWAAYAGRGDVRKSAAIVDALLRSEGSSADPVRRAVRVLVAHATGDQRRAWCERLLLLGAQVPPRHAVFVAAALTASDRAFGLVKPAPVSTAPAAYADNVPARMADGDTATFYWSDGAPRPGAQFVLDLGRVRPVEEVAVAMGTSARPKDFLRSGVLEGSVDGVDWVTVRQLPGRATVTATLGPDPRDVRYLRLRATAGQRHWLAVREVSVLPGPTDVTTDGDPGTGYRVTGEPLVVNLGTAQAVDRVVVLADTGTRPGAPIQVRDPSGTWRTVGRIAGQYTDVAAHGLVGEQVRVRFGPDSTGTSVREIVVRPAR
ncbi:hyaluronoglucosaminidase [Actinokineospora baliensis]|uniref:discoidin domain-containing protein n=1 Tax=Actinokineospora baliensis TaxID=547056 RepID=UPI0019587377|nr:discoidin domain-containing protein [Actinokineospora baliensis]MBM7772798.1 hyaluronoglucosaminidase [Actinokineospora baliensis]